MGENTKEKKQKEQEKKCFIITPIGDTSSETFRMAKGVIESVIKPLLSQYGYTDIKPSYEINQTGMITTQIINRIIDDDLVIANLTGNNPNVMYELCLRHVVAKPIIHICQTGTNLPFDIKDNRTIFYKNDMMGVQELSSQMEMFLQEIDYSKEYSDNPIYNAKKIGRLLREVPEESENKLEIELLQNILDSLNDLQHSKKVSNVSASIGRERIFAYDVKITGNAENTHVAFECLSKRLKACGLYYDRWHEGENNINVRYYRNINAIVTRDFLASICKEIAEKYDVKIEFED